MGNEYGAADFQPHLVNGLTFHKLLDWGTATGIFTVLAGGYHAKMRLRHVFVEVKTLALNATEPVINITHGANEVVATADMETILSATATIGEMKELTILDAYKDLAAADALQIEVETADGGGAGTLGLFTFEYELVE